MVNVANIKEGLLLILRFAFLNFRGGAIQFFGTQRHHDKWLSDTESYAIKGCFAMSELGHGSNVCEGYSILVCSIRAVFEFLFSFLRNVFQLLRV